MNNIQITDLQRHGALQAPELHLLYIWIFTCWSVGRLVVIAMEKRKYHSLSLVSSVKRNMGYNNILLYQCFVRATFAAFYCCLRFQFLFPYSSISPVGLRKCMQFVRWMHSILCGLIRWMWMWNKIMESKYELTIYPILWCIRMYVFITGLFRMALSKRIGKL